MNVADFLLLLLNKVVYFLSISLLLAYTVNSSRVLISRLLATAIEKSSVRRLVNQRLINMEGDNDSPVEPATTAAGVISVPSAVQ